VESLRYLAATYNNLSVLHIESVPEQAVRCGEEALDKAVECYDKALAIQQRLVEEHPEVREYQRDLALTYNNLGSLQRRRQRLSKAAHCFGQAISLQRQLVDATPDRKDYRSDLAVSCNNLGLVQRGLGLPADAERSFAESLGLQELLVRQHPRNVEFLSILGGIYNNLGMVREGMRREVDAADAYAFAVKYQRVAHTAAPKIDRFRIYLSKHYYNYGRVLRQLHRPDEAVQVALARKALWPGDAKKLFTVAEEIALACGVPGQGNSSPHENDVVWQRHANQCLAVLKEAVDAGLPLLDAIADNDAFASVRDHPDFFAMVNDQN
jgi:tetratricopeptide (TPR) repeat protein